MNFLGLNSSKSFIFSPVPMKVTFALKIGSPKKIAELMPGVPSSGKTKELLDRQEENIGKFINIMDSMTKQELEEPKTIDAKRINRIAKGSGTSEELVRELLEQYRKMKTVMKMSNNRQFSGLLRRFGIKIWNVVYAEKKLRKRF